MRILAPILLLAALAACGTPQEQCIYQVSRDLRILDRLIAGLETDIARGYRMEEYTVTEPRWVPCGPPPGRPPGPPPGPGPGGPGHGGPGHGPGGYPGGYPGGAPRMCFTEVERTFSRPVAIDIAAETRKLNGLKAKRREVARTTEQQIAACKASYPETK